MIQGERDPFGMPPDGPLRKVVRVAGDHGLKADRAAIAAAAAEWLEALVSPRARPARRSRS